MKISYLARLFLKTVTNLYYQYALGKHLARVDGVIGDANAKQYFYHTDHLGTIKTITDINHVTVWTAEYSAFGTQLVKDKKVTDFEEDDHRYTGKSFDQDIGLYYYNARWYDSETARFIQEDPAGDPNNPNLYSYCSNNPLIYTDPTGLWESYGHSFLTREGAYSTGFGYRTTNTGFMVSGNTGADCSRGELNKDGSLRNKYGYDYFAHFSPFSNAPDTRDMLAKAHLQNAINRWNNGDRNGALDELGAALHSIEDKYAHDGWAGNNNFFHNLASAIKNNPDNVDLKPDAFYEAYIQSCELMNEFREAVGLPIDTNYLNKPTFLNNYLEYLVTDVSRRKDYEKDRILDSYYNKYLKTGSSFQFNYEGYLMIKTYTHEDTQPIFGIGMSPEEIQQKADSCGVSVEDYINGIA